MGKLHGQNLGWFSPAFNLCRHEPRCAFRAGGRNPPARDHDNRLAGGSWHDVDNVKIDIQLFNEF
jgi:hypothetical protein